MGFMGYYCRFITKFMQVAWPLHKLTSGKNAGKKKDAIKRDSRCQLAFDDLKKLCTMAPILAYANFTKPFKLHTDACGTGLGALLYQTQGDGTKAVIAYASRSLSKAKSHYPAHKLEFPTLKWAVVEKLLQLVLPAAQTEVALRGCHDEVGHLGLECMLDLMCDRFFWPHMAAQVKEHVGKCCPCLAFKARLPKAPLENIVATHL